MQLTFQPIALALTALTTVSIAIAPASYAVVDVDELRQENLDKDAANFDELRQENLEKDAVDFEELRQENLEKDAIA